MNKAVRQATRARQPQASARESAPQGRAGALPEELSQLGETTTMAVMYLRVSTKEQATRGGRDEGFSIPAQRQAVLRKASELNAIVVEEFVEAGESAKTAARPALQAMIEYVKTHPVSYCLVHKLDRLARNRADDVQIHLALQSAGVTLVSASESIDETPSGMLVHGIMATIAEFYSRNLAAEVTKGLTEKAKTGGTPNKAPIGYVNVRRRDELGREVRAVELDPERAPLVKWAFEAYATGRYSTSALREELIDRGLTRPPTPKRAPGSPSLSTIHAMLRNSYYKGDVVFKGDVYAGLHPALVGAETWWRVQTLLDTNNVAGIKTQCHTHHLKGVLFCGQCGSRMIVSNAKSRNGSIYPYFLCAGRHSKRTGCTLQAAPVATVEALVEDAYRRITVPGHVVTALRDLLTIKFEELYQRHTEDREQAKRDKAQLLEQRRALMQAHYAGAVPLDLLRDEQESISRRIAFLDVQIQAGRETYDNAKAHLEDLLDIAADAHALYMSIPDEDRRICNMAFFDRIEVTQDAEQRDQVEPKPHWGMEIILAPAIHELAVKARQTRSQADVDALFKAVTTGLNITDLVPPTGFEPVLPP